VKGVTENMITFNEMDFTPIKLTCLRIKPIPFSGCLRTITQALLSERVRPRALSRPTFQQIDN